MREQLDVIQAISFGRLELRRVAFEFGGSQTQQRSITDVAALKQNLENSHSRTSAQDDVPLLASLVARQHSLEFDPTTDVEASSAGGFRVSETYWRKLVASQRREPWVFICSYAMNRAASVHTDIHGVTYGFHENVTTWRGIVASGPGSIVVFYNTSNAPSNKRTYSSVARVRTIQELPRSSGSLRTWRAHLSDYRDIRPVAASRVEIPGRNPQHGIQAISWTAFKAILTDEPEVFEEHSTGFENINQIDRSQYEEEDLLRNVMTVGSDLVIPTDTTIALNVSPELEYMPDQRDTDDLMAQGRSARDQFRNKAAEIRGIEISTAYLQAQGWTLKRDCQKLGMGYDLQFTRGSDELHVEVKGIRGSRLAFNMTAKEWHTCRTDHQFLLIAVTEVLDNREFRINVLWPHQIVSLARRATQYRFQTDHSKE